MRSHVACTALLALSSCAGAPAAPESPSRVLFERSVAYHDPGCVWGRETVPLRWTGLGDDGSRRYVFDMEIGPGSEFAMRGTRAGHELEYGVTGGVPWARVDGAEEIPDDLREKLVLNREGGLFWRDYLAFLAGLPMCLDVPHATLDEEVERTELEGREVLALRVRFDPEVGTDLWTLYLDPATAALVGCRFDFEDPERDGETIVFQGEVEIDGLRLPARRGWYVNSDWRFLGDDLLEARADG